MDWDGTRGLYVTLCDRCAESMTAASATHAYGWAETHHCDPELAALLADICGGTAA